MMKEKFYQSVKKMYWAVGAAAIVVASGALSPVAAQSGWGSITGTKDDTYVINNDNTNVYTSLRLQNSNNKGWNMINWGNSLSWSFSQNSSYQDFGTELMHLMTDGKLGIGAMDPLDRLHVNGAIRWGSGSSYGQLSTAEGTGLKLRTDGGNSYIDFVNDRISNYDLRLRQIDKYTLRLTTMSGTEANSILDVWGKVKANSIEVAKLEVPALHVSNGNIIPMGLTSEVGGDTPLLNFDVNFRTENKKNDKRGAAFRIDSRNESSLFQWLKRSAGSGDEHSLMELTEKGDLLIRGDGTAGGGNVGIGTATPDKGKLHVVGSLHVENAQGKQTFHVSAGKQLVFVGDSAFIQYQASQVAGSTSVINDENFSLWVSKGIVTEDLAIAKPGDWADYVFAGDYKLISLEDVEDYIRENGHLPAMPSEAEVKAQGYSVHDINKKLLQKIEELTLYTIELHKKTKLLEQQNASYEDLAARLLKLEKQAE